MVLVVVESNVRILCGVRKTPFLSISEVRTVGRPYVVYFEFLRGKNGPFLPVVVTRRDVIPGSVQTIRF